MTLWRPCGCAIPATPVASFGSASGMTVTAFAKQIGIPRVDLSNILHGKQSISAEAAQKLGQAFPNQDAALWLRLQNSYDRAHDADFEGTMELARTVRSANNPSHRGR